MHLSSIPLTQCPEWCLRSPRDHGADEVGPGCPPMHYGPDFGAIGLQGYDQSRLHAIVYLEPGANESMMTAGDLRKLAADAVSAADWMEAQQ